MDIGKRFDSVANRYDTPDKLERSKIFVNHILSKVPVNKNFKVLDIGAGTGTVDILLSPSVKNVVATDLSEGMLNVFQEKIKKENIKNIKLLKADVFSGDFSEKDFDMILTSMTFHHIDNPASALKKLKSLLKDKGYIVIIDLYKEDGTFHSDNTDVKHFGFDETDIKNWIKEAGLKEKYYGIIYSIKKEREGKIREYPIFMTIIIKE